MVIFQRSIEPKIKSLLFKKRAILIFGPRQAGKTTLAKKIVDAFGAEGAYFNCEEAGIRKHFVIGEPDLLHALVGNKKVVVFDEAQTIQNIGKVLKVFIDTYPDVQVIATGSSSFDLANKINEPLTGRAFEFILYPLSLQEIRGSKQVDRAELLECMRVGMYPAIVGEPSAIARDNLLKNIATNYLYKDIFVFESIRNPQIFEEMIKMLALQIGQLVSVNELATSLGASRTTIQKYLRLLEQSYITKRVYSFSRNRRNELKKAFKVYFLDLGIRNAVIDSIGAVEARNDRGAIFENLFYAELLKNGAVEPFPPAIHFWRTFEQKEVDFVLLHGEEISAYECKWSVDNVSFSDFLKRYPQASAQVMTLDTLIS